MKLWKIVGLWLVALAMFLVIVLIAVWVSFTLFGPRM